MNISRKSITTTRYHIDIVNNLEWSVLRKTFSDVILSRRVFVHITPLFLVSKYLTRYHLCYVAICQI